MRQLHMKIGFLVVPVLAAKVLLGLAFICKDSEKISPTITAMISRSVAILNATDRDHILKIKIHDSQK